ncbi:fumarylacetoacetate hydrolase family protein [Tateyamaria omphalii]|nr:fumarylacetoacetate hydrolase family protein [Tateyamaria omphalii]
MKTAIYLPVLIIVICIGLIFSVRDDPARTNPISAESAPLVPGVLPSSEAITLAKTHTGVPLLVTGLADGLIKAIDLTNHGAQLGADLFDAFAAVGETRLAKLEMEATGSSGVGHAESYTFAQLASAAGDGERHLSSGTNFPEHAEETNSQSVFAFPKFGPPSPPVTTVVKREGVLLDYEVELCVRFDRDIATVEDFDAARKGFFLCADFTDRAVLSRMIDVDNFDSGSGFSDAKSGPDFFPTGPFLVIPTDWERFVTAERITTHRGNSLRQDARGGEMILNFRQLIEKALSDLESERFVFRGQHFHLLDQKRLARGQALMSGTPEGVIFMPPTSLQITRGGLQYVLSGSFLRGQSGYDSVVEAFIREELRAGRFLQAGEVIRYSSSSMGEISITVVSENEDEVALNGVDGP